MMKPIFKILTLLSLLLAACESDNRSIFWVSVPSGHENDFLFMAESTNIPKIESDSTMYFLTKEELFSAERLTFKNFGKIHSDKQFNVYVLLKEGSDIGRDYTFIIRTYDNDFRPIDSYELASWIDSENRHCYGSINEKLTIERTCMNEEVMDIMQIESNGRIVIKSKNVKQ